MRVSANSRSPDSGIIPAPPLFPFYSYFVDIPTRFSHWAQWPFPRAKLTVYDMDSEAPVQPATARQRSRLGCYTCKFRKVKCEAASRQSETTNGAPSGCSNRKRLGFQCRWSAGEQFAPPPKRRRTIGRCCRRMRRPTIQVRPTSNNLMWRPRLPLRASPPKPSRRRAGIHPSADGRSIGAAPISESTEAVQSLEWPPIRIPAMTRDQLTTGNHDDGSLESSSDMYPSVNDDNRQLIQHYLEVMKGYSKVDERSKDANNLFISAFSQSLLFPPLFYAILAFSASHMSIQDESYVAQATNFDRLATESFETFKRDHQAEVEGLLSALFVRIKKVHVMGGSADSFLALISAASDIVATEHGAATLQPPTALARRIILRLAILDSWAACYRLDGGALISRLKKIPSLAFIFDSKIDGAESLGAVVNLLRANMLRMHVARWKANSLARLRFGQIKSSLSMRY
ncbi:hypothetical protein B0T10DRAFT_571530 [Thelonectria olida]|uniref:Zn(2)-C6 fungal-type domain-containing protein n=1 Tax=Thelonectria olida TaxID=1576542 RepID=A0A9P8WLW8_9HYPO|nr:hypothetical protein B0T10DRAFT_571530 [Thelonectria olida]